MPPAAPERTFESQRHGFRVTLPEGWSGVDAVAGSLATEETTPGGEPALGWLSRCTGHFCEGCHSNRLRVRHLLIDPVELPVLERPQRDAHLGDCQSPLFESA